MRKTFKVFFLVLSLIFVASFFTSCSHSDADSHFPRKSIPMLMILFSKIVLFRKISPKNSMK